jgi:gamma-glutamyltranspeptidase/glutathione hydrolase
MKHCGILVWSIVSTMACVSAAVAQTPGEPIPSNIAPVREPHAMVVTIHHDATDAGVEVLKQGGNAVDAAVAVGFALAVVLPAAGNIGGGGFMLIRPAKSTGPGMLGDGRPHFIDYREKAPAAATANMYLDAQGNVVRGESTVGYKASGVPGTVAGLAYAEQRYGRLGLAKVMAPAIRLARDGYVLTEEEARTLHSNRLAEFAESHHIFQRDGDFYRAGDIFKQPLLAATLQRIAANPEDFYRGKMAAEIAAFEAARGGLITAADLAAYQAKDRTPLLGHYHGYEVLTAPPPSSGGVVLLEILNILSGYDLSHLNGAPSPDRSAAQIHYITEAFRRAYMDRADYLGDPDFNPDMPIAQMLNPAYAAAWRATIQPVAPSPSATLMRPTGYMPPPPGLTPMGHESPQTTHYSIVDAEGNAVSTTYTLNFGFGSGVTVAGLGFLLNDEMDDFASKMGVPNGFGLIQGPANAIAAGKRPLSSMTPTIVSAEPVCRTISAPHATHRGVVWMQAGQAAVPGGGLSRQTKIPAPCTPGAVRLVLGSPGGSTIMTTVANDLISIVDNGLSVQAAADAPRFHHQYLPDVLQFEKAFPQSVVGEMKSTGYVAERAGAKDEDSAGTWGDSELIARDPRTGELAGGQDKRHHFGKAAGY